MRFSGYRTDGFHDEMFAASGAPRPEARLVLETVTAEEHCTISNQLPASAHPGPVDRIVWLIARLTC